MDLSNLKSMFNGFVGTVSEKGRTIAGDAADKAKSAGRIAKLTLELNGEKESLKKAFANIGQTYYENKDSNDLLVQLCEEADGIKERINAIEAELLQLKSEFAPKEADVEVSFEEVVDEAESAAECECKCECAEEAVEEAVEEVVEKAEEAVEEIVEEAKDAVEEVVEEVKDEE